MKNNFVSGYLSRLIDREKNLQEGIPKSESSPVIKTSNDKTINQFGWTKNFSFELANTALEESIIPTEETVSVSRTLSPSHIEKDHVDDNSQVLSEKSNQNFTQSENLTQESVKKSNESDMLPIGGQKHSQYNTTTKSYDHPENKSEIIDVERRVDNVTDSKNNNNVVREFRVTKDEIVINKHKFAEYEENELSQQSKQDYGKNVPGNNVPPVDKTRIKTELPNNVPPFDKTQADTDLPNKIPPTNKTFFLFSHKNELQKNSIPTKPETEHEKIHDAKTTENELKPTKEMKLPSMSKSYEAITQERKNEEQAKIYDKKNDTARKYSTLPSAIQSSGSKDSTKNIREQSLTRKMDDLSQILAKHMRDKTEKSEKVTRMTIGNINIQLTDPHIQQREFPEKSEPQFSNLDMLNKSYHWKFRYT